MGEAPVDVILDQEQANLVGGGGKGLDLLEDVEAVRLLLDEALDAACLALDAAQARHELVLVLGVGVAEMWSRRIGAHTAGQYVSAAPGGQSSALPDAGSMTG